jgi:ubiquinone/menaquinone biosynthesis C-methylase UbiE
MQSFIQSNLMQRKASQPEAQAAMRAVLDASSTANQARLNQPLTPLRQLLALANYGLAWCRGPSPADCLDPENVAAANAAFEKLFHGKLHHLTLEALAAPENYLRKIRSYEKRLNGRPLVPFATENDNYRLIVKDPLRIQEEHFVFNAMLNSDLLDDQLPSVLDLGTGSGRLAFCMAELLRRSCAASHFETYGLDIDPANIRDALETKSARGYGPQVKFVTGDMTRTPFLHDRFGLCSAASSVYLVPAYARVLCLLEMVRILKPGGEGVITGPNEHFSVLNYTYCMGASNLRTYINPVNMYLAQKLGGTGMLIEAVARQRQDYAFPDTSELCLALELTGCRINKVEYWPKSNVPPLFTGIHFRKTATTNRSMAHYNDFMNKRIEDSGVKPI